MNKQYVEGVQNRKKVFLIRVFWQGSEITSLLFKDEVKRDNHLLYPYSSLRKNLFWSKLMFASKVLYINILEFTFV